MTATAVKIWYLKRFPLFHGFTPSEMEEIERQTQMRNLETGRVLYLPGQSGQHVFLIKSGVVKLSRLLPDGRELTLALLGPGDLFGGLEVVGGEPRDAQAVVYRPVMLCAMRESDLVRWMARQPDLALRVTKWVGFRLQVLTNRLQDLLFRSASERLASSLLDLGERFGRTTDAGVVIDLAITHRELANLTGCVRETVSDVLGDFRERGWVGSQGRRIVLRDLEALRRSQAARPVLEPEHSG